jgi:hypothetical protein
MKEIKMNKKTKDEIKDLELKIKANEDRRVELDKQRVPIEREMVKLYKINETLRDKMDKLKISSGDIGWESILQCNHYESSIHHTFRNEKLYSIGLRSCGYNIETEQTCIQIAMIRGDQVQFEKVISGLNIVMPFLKDDKKGNLKIHIMEESLSYHASYSLVINRKDKTFKVCRNGFTNREYNNLESAIAYIQENLWYENDDEEALLGNY